MSESRLLYLIEQYRKATLTGTRAREHEARQRLFDYAQEVMDSAQSAELDSGGGTGRAGVEPVRIQRVGGSFRISPAGDDGDSQTPEHAAV